MTTWSDEQAAWWHRHGIEHPDCCEGAYPHDEHIPAYGPTEWQYGVRWHDGTTSTFDSEYTARTEAFCADWTVVRRPVGTWEEAP